MVLKEHVEDFQRQTSTNGQDREIQGQNRQLSSDDHFCFKNDFLLKNYQQKMK